MADFNEQQLAYWHDQVQKERRHPSHPVVRAYVSPKVGYLSKFVDFGKEFKVLDVGAGNGYFSYYFDKVADVTAVDYSEVILNQNPVPKKAVMDARHLEFADESFDLVFCHALLHHIAKNERKKVLDEMKRVSKKYVVTIEPNRNNPLMFLFGLLKREERGTLDFSLSYLKSLFTTSGLQVVKASPFGFLTPNRMPIPKSLLSLENKIFERPLWCGMTSVVIGHK